MIRTVFSLANFAVVPVVLAGAGVELTGGTEEATAAAEVEDVARGAEATEVAVVAAEAGLEEAIALDAIACEELTLEATLIWLAVPGETEVGGAAAEEVALLIEGAEGNAGFTEFSPQEAAAKSNPVKVPERAGMKEVMRWSGCSI